MSVNSGEEGERDEQEVEEPKKKKIRKTRQASCYGFRYRFTRFNIFFVATAVAADAVAPFRFFACSDFISDHVIHGM